MFSKIKFIISFPVILFAQLAIAQKPNWQNLDLKTDSIFGISTDMAYAKLFNGKKAQTIIVAVIDAGVDSAHEDLQPVLWTNPKRSKMNDLHGWNFIGSANGNVHYDNLELTRQVRQQEIQFEGKDTTVFTISQLADFHNYKKEKSNIEQALYWAKYSLTNVKTFMRIMDTIENCIRNKTPGLVDFQNFQPQTRAQIKVREIILSGLKNDPNYSDFKVEIYNDSVHFSEEANYHYNIAYDPRSIVGDDYFNSSQRDYGNNDITGPDATHGTHVAGIIAAIRNNNVGMNGIADHVLIMSVRAVPDGDERDKDVASAIRYAVAHGAKIINMSFGKPYSQDKKAVDDAVKYAMSKDVLIIHAAGNDNKDLDEQVNYPNRNYSNGGHASAWIEVGASGWKNDSTLKAPFSNYGKASVDVFAPGEQIYSTIPGNKYAALDGTSMAAPVVTGLAALIWEYHPKLSVAQVKDIILRSVIKVDHPVFVKKYQHQKDAEVPFTDLCISGGIVNAYSALKLADSYKQ
jgi:subtilisin family serine protease